MASKDYPGHAPTCGCSGCHASNVEQSARNKALEEAAKYIEGFTYIEPREVANKLRGMKYKFPAK